MRHQKKRHKLGRARAHRKATLAALSTALIEHKRITTTVTRAKALRVYVEPLINRAKEDSTHNRREVFRRLQSKQAVTELFSEVATKIGDRPGGFTRVVKLGRRAGDAAEMAVIELVDYNDVQPGGSAGGGRRRRTRRGSSGGGGRRRGGTKTTATATKATTAAPVEAADEKPADTGAAETADVQDQATPESEAPAPVTPTSSVDVAEASVEPSTADDADAAAPTDEGGDQPEAEAGAEPDDAQEGDEKKDEG